MPKRISARKVERLLRGLLQRYEQEERDTEALPKGTFKPVKDEPAFLERCRARGRGRRDAVREVAEELGLTIE